MSLGVFSRQKMFKSMSLHGHECRLNKEGTRRLNPIVRGQEEQCVPTKGAKMEQPLTTGVRKPECVLFWEPREETVSSKGYNPAY